MRACIVAAGLVATARASSFHEWARKHDLSHYTSDPRREALFNASAALVAAHDEKEHGYALALNKFAAQTPDEMRAIRGYAGHAREDEGAYYGAASKRDAAEARFPRSFPARASNRAPAELPKSVDWVAKGATTKVKNQGGCGSCWAFGGTEAIESSVFVETGELPTLSEQLYVSCMPNPDECGGTGGCRGAVPDLLFNFTMSDGGAMLEEDYPYTSGGGSDGKCKSEGKTRSAMIDGYVDVKRNDVEALMEAVAQQPIAIAVDASPWSLYQRGIFKASKCGVGLNHAVLLTGYGEEGGVPYWTVRNSWGEYWGENGYIRLERTPLGEDAPCAENKRPQDGVACKPYPKSQTVCGTCGILFDGNVPMGGHMIADDDA